MNAPRQAAPEAEDQLEFLLEPANNERLANLCGPLDAHLRQIEAGLGVKIAGRGHRMVVTGEPARLMPAQSLLKTLYAETADDVISPDRIHMALLDADREETSGGDTSVRTRRGMIRGRGENQRRYLEAIRRSDLTFGVGPAGTGKTYLAVACAVEALERDEIRRLLLVRPAVEAGERLGFLPGDLAEKIDPYLRPLYDALYEMLGFERVGRLLERKVIEVAPLAYMRGRTLNESFIILDEAQNTTVEQMKMFLTRIGFGSRAVVTGDVTQIDLPRGQRSGLTDALQVLDGVKGVHAVRFASQDVVRHPLVQRIVQAYEAREEQGAGRK